MKESKRNERWEEISTREGTKGGKGMWKLGKREIVQNIEKKERKDQEADLKYWNIFFYIFLIRIR
jgi:hypothetical protein